jgi:DNA end-binding protein Ku
MPRSSWKGYLKLSLVSVPVKGYTATKATSEIRLNQLHSECHSRIKYQKVCPIHGVVPKDEIVSGYEYAEDQYVVIDPAELEQIQGERERAINVDAIVAPRTVDAAYLTDKTYYLVPDGAVGHKPFALIQKCLADDDLEAIGRVVLFGREELVLVRPVKNLLAMTALKYATQVTTPDVLKEEVAEPALAKEEVALTKTLLKAFEKKKFSIAAYQDDYADKLRSLIEAKVEGKELVTPPPTEEPQVINLMDALKKSVAAAQDGGKPASAPKASTRKMASSARQRSKPKARRKSG